jgi:hypothetical protein
VDIRYLIDLSLLNKAWKKSEHNIDTLHELFKGK